MLLEIHTNYFKFCIGDIFLQILVHVYGCEIFDGIQWPWFYPYLCFLPIQVWYCLSVWVWACNLKGIHMPELGCHHLILLFIIR